MAKEDILQVFTDFHDKGMFEHSTNGTFVALIPKNVGALEVKDLGQLV